MYANWIESNTSRFFLPSQACAFVSLLSVMYFWSHTCV
jgi:hypothetical protein